MGPIYFGRFGENIQVKIRRLWNNIGINKPQHNCVLVFIYLSFDGMFRLSFL